MTLVARNWWGCEVSWHGEREALSSKDRLFHVCLLFAPIDAVSVASHKCVSVCIIHIPIIFMQYLDSGTLRFPCCLGVKLIVDCTYRICVGEGFRLFNVEHHSAHWSAIEP